MDELYNKLTVCVFNRFACFWPKGYQRRSLEKNHQNGGYLKQAMRKNPPTGFASAAVGFRSTAHWSIFGLPIRTMAHMTKHVSELVKVIPAR